MAEGLSYSPEEVAQAPETNPIDQQEQSVGKPELDLTDPRIYLSEFEKNIDFQSTVTRRVDNFHEQHPNERLTEEDIISITDTLRADKEYKNKLWDWQKDHPLPINYDVLPDDAKNAIYQYWSDFEEIRKAQREGYMTKDYIQNLDIKRSADHTDAAHALIKHGLAPNVTIGRLLIQFMSIDKGYDRVDRDRDERRLNFFRS